MISREKKILMVLYPATPIEKTVINAVRPIRELKNKVVNVILFLLKSRSMPYPGKIKNRVKRKYQEREEKKSKPLFINELMVPGYWLY